MEEEKGGIGGTGGKGGRRVTAVPLRPNQTWRNVISFLFFLHKGQNYSIVDTILKLTVYFIIWLWVKEARRDTLHYHHHHHYHHHQDHRTISTSPVKTTGYKDNQRPTMHLFRPTPMRKYFHGYSVLCVSAQSPRKESRYPIILGAHGRDSSSKMSDFVLYISQLQAFNKSTVHSREHLGSGPLAQVSVTTASFPPRSPWQLPPLVQVSMTTNV